MRFPVVAVAGVLAEISMPFSVATPASAAAIVSACLLSEPVGRAFVIQYSISNGDTLSRFSGLTVMMYNTSPILTCLVPAFLPVKEMVVCLPAGFTSYRYRFVAFSDAPKLEPEIVRYEVVLLVQSPEYSRLRDTTILPSVLVVISTAALPVRTE